MLLFLAAFLRRGKDWSYNLDLELSLKLKNGKNKVLMLKVTSLNYT